MQVLYAKPLQALLIRQTAKAGVWVFQVFLAFVIRYVWPHVHVLCTCVWNLSAAMLL